MTDKNVGDIWKFNLHITRHAIGLICTLKHTFTTHHQNRRHSMQILLILLGRIDLKPRNNILYWKPRYTESMFKEASLIYEAYEIVINFVFTECFFL